MKGRTPSKPKQGAVATGASATGAASLATLAMGAAALGALAVGALAIGRLSVGRARLRRVEIGELAVGRLEVGANSGQLSAVCRLRAAPGKADALEHLLVSEAGVADLGPLRAYRARADPDLFLLHESDASGPGGARHIDALLQRASSLDLLADAGPPDLDLYRAL